MELKPLKISELNHYINRILSNDALLYSLNVEGEVSNCKYHSSGHIYFSLKDENSKIRCIMFAGNAEKLEITIADGMKLVVTGSINVYEKDGSYQINVRKARDEGRGALYEEFEALKERLYLEGLFDESAKKEIPKYPRKIGIVTSITGSTLRDMVINIRRRNPSVDILIKPAIVQGRDSKDSIVSAIETLNLRADIDTIILGRGGGSIEELWSFNEEDVAKAIYKSRIPIISAVGHETDYTIADFASDKRASTPSVAAEISAPSSTEIEFKLSQLNTRLLSLERGLICSKESELMNLRHKLLGQSPEKSVNYSKVELEVNIEKIKKAFSASLYENQSKLSSLAAKLDSLSPINTLNRGFTFVENLEGDIVSSKTEIREGERLSIRFKDGKAAVKVEEIEQEVKS